MSPEASELLGFCGFVLVLEFQCSFGLSVGFLGASLFLLTRGVWRSSQPISWESAGAASTRGVLHSSEVLYRPAAASVAFLFLLFVFFSSVLLPFPPLVFFSSCVP